MVTTKKRITMALTKHDTKQIELLKKYYGENQTDVIKKAVNELCYKLFSK
jgi:hypothetical protein